MTQHPYLLLTSSENYPGKLLVGESATFGEAGYGLTDENIKNVEIPRKFDRKEIAEIGWYSFAETDITSIFIPKTILRICRGAFENCASLSEVKFEEGSKM